MKLGITEKQLRKIIENSVELSEDDVNPPTEPVKGTSDKQSGGQGYPEVGKWESGVTRGASNQIGVTKWSDTVGSKITRGKANQLK